MDDECQHGMNPAWCGICQGHDDRASTDTARSPEGRPKQELLDHLCDMLGLPREPVGVGSSLPSHVFDAAATAAGVPRGSMPEIGEAIAEKAGLGWGPECDSRSTISGGGSTVTRAGLEVMLRALARLRPFGGNLGA